MNISHFSLVSLVTISASIIAMEAPPGGWRTGKRAEAAARAAQGTRSLSDVTAEFAQGAQKLREKAERDAQDELNHLGILLLSSEPQALAPAALNEEAQIIADIERLNAAFARWQQDPGDLDLRQKLVEIQSELTSKQVQLFRDSKPAFAKTLNNAIEEVSRKRSEIAWSFHGPQSPTAAPARYQRPLARTNTIADEIENLRTARKKEAKRYARNMRLSGLLALGSGGVAIQQKSWKLATLAAFSGGFSLYCQYQRLKLSEEPTEAEKLAFLYQKQLT